MPSNIKVSLIFLAAGNIHFASSGIILQQQGYVRSEQKVPFEMALVKAKEHLTSEFMRDSALSAIKNWEPSTFVGQVARLALALQHAAGLDVSDTQCWREFPVHKSFAAFACMDRPTGQAATALALNILTGGQAPEYARLAKRLIEAAQPWNLPLAKTAMSRGIPVSVVAAADRPFLALGQGEKRRVFWRQFTPSTSHVATTLSTRKDITARLLRDAGLPAPRNVPVSDAAIAIRVAEALGYPVVVKPLAADFGRGVNTDIRNAEQVREAFLRAAEYGPVLVEEQIPGDQHRLLVVHGHCVRVSRQLSARIVGNGISTVTELVETINLTRPDHLTSAGMKIKLDEVALELLSRQGLTHSSIPAAGQNVLLRGNANLSSGGTAETMTETAHPDVLRMAVQAAGLFGIDVAGIDYLTNDVTRSPTETDGAICEINVTPGFVDPEEIIGDYLAPFYPSGDDGRVPTICVVWSLEERGPLADALASLLETNVTRSDEVRFWRESETAILPRRTAAALADPMASAAIISCFSQEIDATGIGLDRCSLAVLASEISRDVVAAVLRIASNVVMPASFFTAMANDPLFTGHKSRVWIAGDGAQSASSHCAGFVWRVAPSLIEVCPRLGSPWRILNVPASDEAILLAAAGVAMGVSLDRISESLRLLDMKQS